MQIAVVVEVAAIAGAKPAVNERRGVGLGIVLVAGNHVRALDDDLAAIAGPAMLALRVHDADANVGPAPDRAGLARRRRGRGGRHLVCSLGHAGGPDDPRAERRLRRGPDAPGPRPAARA